MKITNLNKEQYIRKVVESLSKMEDSNYLLMLSGGNSPMDLYSKLSYSFNYPFPKDIALVDEKWGSYSQHENSNEVILKNSGLLGRARWEKANFHPILEIKPNTPEVEANLYDQELKALFEIYQGRVVAILGMNLEGHIAGIQANSEAMSSDKLVISFETTEVYKYRITITAKAILENFNKVILIINSDEKCGVFDRIMDFESDVNQRPVLLLKNLADVSVFCFS